MYLLNQNVVGMLFTVFLKNRNISSKIKSSKVTDYASLSSIGKYENALDFETRRLIGCQKFAGYTVGNSLTSSITSHFVE